MADQQANVVLTADTSQYQAAMASAEKSTQGTLNTVMALSSALSRLTTSAGKKIEIIGVGQMAAMTAMGKAAANLETQMAQLRGSAVLSGKSIDAFDKNITSLRKNFGQSREAAIALTQQLNTMGQSTSGIKQMSESFVRLSAVSGEAISGLVDGLIGLQRQMGTVGSDYTKQFAANLANVSQKAGVSATSVLQFSNAIAPIGKVAGMTTNEIMGVSTAFSKAGADGYAAANAFNKMLTDITRSIQYGSPELKAYSNLIGVSVDQFKEMPKTEAVTRIFEEINKQGPGAIKTLERFGLDGIRTMRSLQAVASTGGIRESVENTLGKPGQNAGDFIKASDDAMKGFNETMEKLHNNAQMAAESVGKGFLPAMNGLATAANSLVSSLTSVLSLFGKIPGISGGLGAVATMAGGAALMALPKMIMGAGIAQLVRNPLTMGIGEGFRGGGGRGYEAYMARDEMGRYTRGPIQRGSYWLGSMLGGITADLRARIPEGEPGQPGRLSRAGAAGIRGVTGLLRYGLEPMDWRTMWNPMRERETAIPSQSTRGAWYDQQRERLRTAREQFADVRAERTVAAAAAGKAVDPAKLQAAADRLAMSQMAAATSATRAAAANGEQAAAARASRGAFSQLIVSTRELGAAMLRAGAGGAGGIAMGVGKLGMSALGGLASTIGPLGLAMGAFAAFSAVRGHEQGVEEEQKASYKEDTSAGAKYRAALGEASVATMTFAEAVKQSSAKISKESGAVLTIGQALKVTAEDTKIVSQANRQYTDAAIAGMNQAQATTYAGAILPSASPGTAQLLKYDLLKRFGDRGQVQNIIASAQRQQTPIGDLFSQIGEEQSRTGWLGIGAGIVTGHGASEAAKTAGGTARAAIAAAQPSQQAQTTTAIVNQALQAAYSAKGGEKAVRLISNQLAATMGIESEEGKQALLDAIMQGRGADPRAASRGLGGQQGVRSAKDRQAATLAALMKGDTDATGQFKNLLEAQKQAAQEQHVTLAQIQATAQVPTAQINKGGGLQLAEGNVALIKGTAAGQALMGARGAFAEGFMSEADSNKSREAVQEFTNQMIRNTGSLQEAIQSFTDLKNSGIALSSREYELADAAQQEARARRDRAMQFAGSAAQAQVANADFQSARMVLANNPQDPNAGKNYDQELQRRTDLQNQLGQKALGYLYARRNLEIQEARGQTAFDLQKSQQEHDYNLQRQYALEDYNKQRTRSEEAYQLQRQYAEEDYTQSREWAQQAFDKQRRRQEEDWTHQKIVMAEQAAKSIYDINQRVQVANTMSAQGMFANMMDQQARMEKQAQDLAAARKMGVSGDVIKMLGLNEASGAQQLARFLEDVAGDPSLIGKYNKAAQDRTKAAGALVMDKDNANWQEMQRSHDKSRQRADEDFQTSMDQQAIQFEKSMDRNRKAYDKSMRQSEIDFNASRDRQALAYKTSVDRMNAAFKLQMDNAKTDLNTSMEEITGSWSSLADTAISTLTGTAKAQMKSTKDALDDTATQVSTTTSGLVSNVTELMNSLGIGFDTSGIAKSATGGKMMTGTVFVNGKRTNLGQMAEGGEVKRAGSVHSRDDKVPTLLTTGEYVQPRDSVDHYGKDVMELIRKRRLPREMLMGFNKGGLVDFGHWLQSLHYHVSEHPMFGGVHPVHTKGSWHYKAGAIDVNADDFREGEKAAIDKIVGYARQYGLRTIWQTAGHFNHAHFDIGGGPDMVPKGYKVTTGKGGDITNIEYNTLFTALQKLQDMQKMNKIFDQHLITSRWGHDFLSAAIATTYAKQGAQDYSSVANGPVKRMAQQMAAVKGWTGSQWGALDWIVQHESSWNPQAKNPSSTAFGLFQFLDSTWKAMGGSKTADPRRQIELGLKYIGTRYGDPLHAQAFWKAHNWYDEGAVFNQPTKIGVGDRGAEAVFPLNERGADFLMTLMKKYTGGDFQNAVHRPNSSPVASQQISYFSKDDHSNHFHGDIAVKAEDPYEMIRKLEEKQRMSALTGGTR